MKTKKAYCQPLPVVRGYTHEQHSLLRRGEVLVINPDGLVGRGRLPDSLFYAWGRPEFHKLLKIEGYDTFRGPDHAPCMFAAGQMVDNCP